MARIIKGAKKNGFNAAVEKLKNRGRAFLSRKNKKDESKEESWVKHIVSNDLGKSQIDGLIKTYERISQMFKNEGELEEQEKTAIDIVELKNKVEISQIEKEQEDLVAGLNTLIENIAEKINEFIESDLYYSEPTKTIQKLEEDIKLYEEKIDKYKKNDD